jgi:inner membrane protein
MHLFLDYMITKGVPLIYPFETERFSAELMFHYEIIILLFSVSIAFWLIRNSIGKKSVSRSANNKLLALFLIVLLTSGGLRVEGKDRAIAIEGKCEIPGDLKGDFEVFPDWGLFQWNILKQNESSFQIYSYDALGNKTSYLVTYPRMHVEPDPDNPKSFADLNSGNYLEGDVDLRSLMSADEIMDLQESMSLADSLPKVALFRWRACAIAVNAYRNNGSWLLEYYDPVGRAGMVKAPRWMRAMTKRSSSLEVWVDGDKACIIS